MNHLTLTKFQEYYPTVDVVTLSNLRDNPMATGIDADKVQAQIDAGNSKADSYLAIYADRVGVAFPFTKALAPVVARQVAAIVLLQLESSSPREETIRAADQAIKWFEAVADGEVALTYDDGTLVSTNPTGSKSRGAYYNETGVIDRGYLSDWRIK